MVLWRELRRDELRATTDVTVVIPVGATEQHGLHLPTGTDSDIVTAVAVAAAEAVAARGTTAVVLPTIEFGVSAHHLRFGGTISVRTETQLGVLRDVLDSLETQGFVRALILNGHGGNAGVCAAVASEADARRSLTVATTSWWDAAGVANPGHAGAIETSVQLALGRSVPATHARSFPALPDVGARYHGGWVWALIDGVSDDPSAAVPADGAALIHRATHAVADIIHNLDRFARHREADS